MGSPEIPAAESRPYSQPPQQVKNDPWRRTMGLNLRCEGAKFILTAFGLDVFSGDRSGSAASLSPGVAEKRFAERFARFLGSEPEAHFALDHRRFISLRVPKTLTDVSLCEYGPDGELKRLEPVFDARQPVAADAPELAEAIHNVITAFNQTRTISELKRPQRLARGVSRAGSAAARRIGARILAGTALSFQSEPATRADRFTVPDFRAHRGFGVGYMAARCRWSPDGRSVDLWLQCHHAGADGGPVQEMLDRLQASWGVTAPVILPAADARTPDPAICSFDGERKVGLLTDFVDFTPLVQLRRELASRLAGRVDTVPMAGLLMWCLSHQPEFATAGINTAVDVPAQGGQPRAVDLVALWPQKYHGKADGFATFLRDLLRLFAEARLRQTPTWKSMVLLNSVPTPVSTAILRFTNGTRDRFGTLTVSLVKGTNMVIAPMPDSSWDHGFIAVGNLGVASESGPPVTPVSIKGDPSRIRSYPSAIRRAIAESRNYAN